MAGPVLEPVRLPGTARPVRTGRFQPPHPDPLPRGGEGDSPAGRSLPSPLPLAGGAGGGQTPSRGGGPVADPRHANRPPSSYPDRPLSKGMPRLRQRFNPRRTGARGTVFTSRPLSLSKLSISIRLCRPTCRRRRSGPAPVAISRQAGTTTGSPPRRSVRQRPSFAIRPTAARHPPGRTGGPPPCRHHRPGRPRHA